MFFSNAFWHRFFVDFWGLRPWKINKNHCFFNGFCEFSQNRRFRNISENMVMLASFLEAKTMKKREQIMLKNVFFLNIDFQLLFSGLLRFEDDFGRPRSWLSEDPPKIIKNRKKSIPGRIRSAFQNSIRFGRQFWSNHWRFWIDFWTILKVFWKNFEETCSLRNGFCRTYFDD